jgi:hypothetical protein
VQTLNPVTWKAWISLFLGSGSLYRFPQTLRFKFWGRRSDLPVTVTVGPAGQAQAQELNLSLSVCRLDFGVVYF